MLEDMQLRAFSPRTQEAYVRQHFQLQLEIALLALAALGGLAWRPIGAGLEAGIAQPVKAALGHDQALARYGQVTQHLAGVLVTVMRVGPRVTDPAAEARR